MDTTKIKISKIVFSKSSYKPITWKEIKHLKFEDDDTFDFKYVPPVYTNEYGREGYFSLEVFRMIEEDDQEFKRRIENYIK